jgi:hypothetical protein
MRQFLGLPPVGVDLTRSVLTPEWLTSCEETCCRGEGLSSAWSVTCEASAAGVITGFADPLSTWVAARGVIEDGRGDPSEASFSCGQRRGGIPTKGRSV